MDIVKQKDPIEEAVQKRLNTHAKTINDMVENQQILVAKINEMGNTINTFQQELEVQKRIDAAVQKALIESGKAPAAPVTVPAPEPTPVVPVVKEEPATPTETVEEPAKPAETTEQPEEKK